MSAEFCLSPLPGRGLVGVKGIQIYIGEVEKDEKAPTILLTTMVARIRRWSFM
jgi:hypothetical protein